MKKNWIELVLIIVSITVPCINEAAHNIIALPHEISVVEDRFIENSVPVKTVFKYTPPAPYNNITFTITAPVKVCVGQTFAIDYAIDILKFTHVSHWSDLVPDDSQGLPIKIIDVIHPTIGTFTTNADSLARKGGRGVWIFPKGLPGSTVQHLKILVQATAPGLIKFQSIAATNPPFYMGARTFVTCNAPVAKPIHVLGYSGEPLDFSILDYIIADSELKITNITQTSYGEIKLNPDYTLTYTPYLSFYGNDSFTYSVADAAGNVIQGVVAITIQHSPAPEIIR